MLNNRGIRYFFHKNVPQVTIPDESTLCKHYLKDVYESVVEKVQCDLAAVKTICLLFDGWTDKHHVIHYLGIRVQFITDDWTGKVITLSVKPCAGDSDSMCDHVQKELQQFFPDYKHKQLFSTHDGASAMKKASRLLKVTGFSHCVAHAIHLLLTSDAMTRVPDIMALLLKCKNIVTTLHFKAEVLESEVTATNDVIACAELLDKISDIKSVLDADDQFCIDENDEPMEEESVDIGDESANVATGLHHFKKVHRLQNEVPTRWNSSLSMIDSLLHLRAEVTNSLKQTGHYDKCLKAHEWAVLEELRNFLQSFASMTDLVSSHITYLSLIPLVRAEVIDACKASMKDCDEVKSLKKLILNNIDKRLPLTNDVNLSTLMDPSTKSLVSLSHDEKHEPVYSAVVAASQPKASTSSDADQQGESGQSTSATYNASQLPPSGNSQTEQPPVSKKMKLLLKHTPQPNESEADSRRIRNEINNYLQYIPGDQEDDPLLFWKRGLFPSLEEAAKSCLTRSASSVPVENLFSTMGLLLNGKRSTLAPHRANWLSFIHDNYATYFDVDL